MSYTVYQPKHWVFAGTDLYFGDSFGGSVRVYAYEVDGVDFDFKFGRPCPTHTDGAPESLEILAMGVSSNVEEDHGNPGTYLYAGDGNLQFVAQLRYGDPDPQLLENSRYGAGMLAAFTRGTGEVVNVGSIEWVNGLNLENP